MTARSNPSSDTEFSAGERRTLLMGRSGEVRVLEDALAAAQKTRSCRTVTVLGASGVGKTRLVREFLSRVGATATPSRPTRIFRTSAKGATEANGVFARLFRSRFGVADGTDPEAAKAHVSAELTAVLEDRKIGDFAHCLGPFFDLDFPDSPLVRAVADDPQQVKALRRAAVRHFWEADATRAEASASPTPPAVAGATPPSSESAKAARPLILVFEDMHAAADDSIDLLASLIDTIRAPILLVCVARPDLLVRREDWLARGEGRHAQLDLLPLGESDAAAFMHELLTPCGDDPAKDELVDAAVMLAGGNPALLEQVVRIFRETGVLESATEAEPTGAERWAIRPEMLESVHIPLSVEDAVQARIAGLSPAERALLERAATMGGLFWFGGLLAIHRQDGPVPEIWSSATANDGGQIRALLAELVEKDYLLKLPDSTFPGDEEYVFKHNLEREALVKLTSSRARQRYHAIIADWLAFKENISSNEDSLAMLAMHRDKSGALVPTVRAYFLAADVARAHHANTRAHEYYQRGFALIREGAAVELDVRLAALHDHGDILQSLGRHDEARAAFREMLERSFRLDVRAKGGAAHARIGRLCRDTGRLEEAEQHLRAALALFDQTADDRGVASTTDDLGKLHWLRGDYAKALDYGERGLAMRRAIGDQRSIALSLNNLGLVYQDSGQFKKALASFEQALGIRREIGDKGGIAQSLNNLGSVAQDCRDDARALGLYTEAYDLAKETGDRNRIALYLTNIGETHNRLGAADKAVAVLKQAEELADDLGDKLVLAEALRGLGKAYLTLRQFTRARECAARAVELFREVESKVQVGVALRSLGEVMAAASAGGDTFAQAAEHIRQSIATFEEIGNDIELARSCRSYAQLLRVSPDHGRDPQVAVDAAAYMKRAEDILAKLTISVRGFEPDAFFSPT
jgi:tetratricopeptide (TPR) repeat protein